MEEKDNKQENDIKQNDSLLDACKIELNQAKDSFLRLSADFENYKKRVIKEKSEWVNISQADLILDLLNIIDDFDRAFEQSKKDEKQDFNVWVKGFELIYKSLQKFLEKYNVQEIKDFSSFNPEYHEAIAQIESASHKSGEIVAVVQKGYLFKDRILRPAKVTVAK